jgi:hypothetical protein
MKTCRGRVRQRRMMGQWIDMGSGDGLYGAAGLCRVPAGSLAKPGRPGTVAGNPPALREYHTI